jgi:hypothetical protein
MELVSLGFGKNYMTKFIVCFVGAVFAPLLIFVPAARLLYMTSAPGYLQWLVVTSAMLGVFVLFVWQADLALRQGPRKTGSSGKRE